MFIQPTGEVKPMSHHEHDHHHDHDHAGESGDALSFDRKLVKLLQHWIRHNDDHAENYRDWARKAKENNFTQEGRLMEDAAEMTLAISQKFEAAIKLIQSRS